MFFVCNLSDDVLGIKLGFSFLIEASVFIKFCNFLLNLYFLDAKYKTPDML